MKIISDLHEPDWFSVFLLCLLTGAGAFNIGMAYVFTSWVTVATATVSLVVVLYAFHSAYAKHWVCEKISWLFKNECKHPEGFIFDGFLPGTGERRCRLCGTSMQHYADMKELEQQIAAIQEDIDRMSRGY